MKSLKPFVCRIIDAEGTIRGTGFFILPNGYIITCYHVVEACKGNVRIGIIGESEPIISNVEKEYETLDIAVLKINRENCNVLPLKSDWKIGDPVFSHGFSIEHLQTFPDEGFPVESILTGTTTSNNRKTEVIVLEKTQVNYGLSGAPAFNGRTEKVIGLITLKYEEGRKALVIPIEQLFEKWALLKLFHGLLCHEPAALNELVKITKPLFLDIDK
jgi:S1-C subfamily serine protease